MCEFPTIAYTTESGGRRRVRYERVSGRPWQVKRYVDRWDGQTRVLCGGDPLTELVIDEVHRSVVTVTEGPQMPLRLFAGLETDFRIEDLEDVSDRRRSCFHGTDESRLQGVGKGPYRWVDGHQMTIDNLLHDRNCPQREVVSEYFEQQFVY